MKIKKGDEVKILLGKDNGKSGKVERVFPKESKILVAGVNVIKRHISKKITGSEGQILDIAKPINLSNVALICPNCKKPTRVGFKINGTDLPAGRQEKVRICKKCGKEI